MVSGPFVCYRTCRGTESSWGICRTAAHGNGPTDEKLVETPVFAFKIRSSRGGKSCRTLCPGTLLRKRFRWWKE